MLLIAVICITVAAVIQFWRDQLDADSIDEAEWIHIGLLLPVRGLLRRLASTQSAIHRAVSEQCSPAFPSFPDRSCSLATAGRFPRTPMPGRWQHRVHLHSYGM
jgi:hypothetical protein